MEPMTPRCPNCGERNQVAQLSILEEGKPLYECVVCHQIFPATPKEGGHGTSH